MPVTDPELITLAASHDIITIGARADDLRQQRHGLRTTFVRVLDVPADVAAPVPSAPAAGELRIVGAVASRAAAIERVGQVAAIGEWCRRLRFFACRSRTAGGD